MTDSSDLSTETGFKFPPTQETMEAPKSPEVSTDSDIKGFSDTVFIVEGEKIHAVRAVLSLWSPVFRAMFDGDLEKETPQEIPLSGANPDTLREFMRVLHPPNKPITDENVSDMIAMAKEYQVEAVLQNCESYLLSKKTSVGLLDMARANGMEKLKDKCMSDLATIIKDFEKIKISLGDSGDLVQRIARADCAMESKYELMKVIAECSLPAVHKFASHYPKTWSQTTLLTRNDHVELCVGNEIESDTKSRHTVGETEVASCKCTFVSQQSEHVVGTCKCGHCKACAQYNKLLDILQPLLKAGISVQKYLESGVTVAGSAGKVQPPASIATSYAISTVPAKGLSVSPAPAFGKPAKASPGFGTLGAFASPMSSSGGFKFGGFSN